MLRPCVLCCMRFITAPRYCPDPPPALIPYPCHLGKLLFSSEGIILFPSHDQ